MICSRSPYDAYLVNKVVDGKQMTIVWHVDDLKISHVDENEVMRTIGWMKGMYGDDMWISWGKK